MGRDYRALLEPGTNSHFFRYIWDPASYDGIDSVPLPFSQTWSPEVILHNSVEEKFIYRRVGVVRHTGEIVYVVSVHTKSACEPNYESYPFGMQLCSLKFGSWVNGQVLYRKRKLKERVE